MPAGYSAAMARQVVGISQRRLDYWDESHIVQPSIHSADGKGSERRYSFDDLVKLALVKSLREAGLSLQKIRKGIASLRKRFREEDPLSGELLVTDGRGLFRRTKNDQLADVLAGDQLVFSIVAVGQIRQEVHSKILTMIPGTIPRRGIRSSRGRNVG